MRVGGALRMTMPNGRTGGALGRGLLSLGTRLRKYVTEREASDTSLAVLIGVLLALLYGAFAWRLSRGNFFAHFNLLFDYDPPAYLNIFAPQAGHGSKVDDIARAIKHPLLSWFSPLSLLFEAFGASRTVAAGFANAAVGGLTSVLMFKFARTVGTSRLDALLVTLIFGLSASQLFSSMIIESYSYAGLSLAIIWYISALRIFRRKNLSWLAALSSVGAFGVTVTNVAQAAIAEFFARLSHEQFRRALRNTVSVGLAVAILCALAVVITWPSALAYVMEHPVTAAKTIYWQQTHGPKTGPAQVVLTFFGLSLAAPHFTTIALPEGILMRDFRTLEMPLVSLGGLLVWNVLFLVAAALALRTERTRIMAGAMLAAIVFNIILHTREQFRGSLFIYTPHIWFEIVALMALGIAAWQPSGLRHRMYLRGVLVLILLVVAPLNLFRALEASRLFDAPANFLAQRAQPYSTLVISADILCSPIEIYRAIRIQSNSCLATVTRGVTHAS
jgi:hypothetical protein